MRILVVDDDRRFADVLCRVLREEGYEEVAAVCSAEDALQYLRTTPCDFVVTDLRLGGMDGINLMGEVKRRSPGTAIVLMTAFADVETARAALTRGAIDYLVKPFDNDELIALAAKARDRRGADGKPQETFAGMTGRSAAMQAVFEKIRKAADTEAAVLILGESGTGKELAARAVHQLSTRSKDPFVAIHAPAIPETLLEGELFGYEKGAFTGADTSRKGQLEAANGGTVFFDEIADMPLTLQAKLLRFLQEHQFTPLGSSTPVTVDVRVLAATNRCIEDEVREGRFREDLLYRIDVIRIELPPLRERVEDIDPLVRRCLHALGCRPSDIRPEALEVLRAYAWPGNVRELENVIERCLVESGGKPVSAASLPEKIRSGPETAAAGTLDLGANERRMIEEALKKAGGNKAKAARLLGITRRRLYSRMERLGLN